MNSSSSSMPILVSTYSRSSSPSTTPRVQPVIPAQETTQPETYVTGREVHPQSLVYEQGVVHERGDNTGTVSGLQPPLRTETRPPAPSFSAHQATTHFQSEKPQTSSTAGKLPVRTASSAELYYTDRNPQEVYGPRVGEGQRYSTTSALPDNRSAAPQQYVSATSSRTQKNAKEAASTAQEGAKTAASTLKEHAAAAGATASKIGANLATRTGEVGHEAAVTAQETVEALPSAWNTFRNSPLTRAVMWGIFAGGLMFIWNPLVIAPTATALFNRTLGAATVGVLATAAVRTEPHLPQGLMGGAWGALMGSAIALTLAGPGGVAAGWLTLAIFGGAGLGYIMARHTAALKNLLFIGVFIGLTGIALDVNLNALDIGMKVF